MVYQKTKFARVGTAVEITGFINKHNFSEYNCKYFLTHHFLTYVKGAQKNCLIETVLLSTHNICFC